jgi:GntR family transcriptional regulator/MocR family aminotransferase
MMYVLKANSDTPLHIQLYEELKEDIVSNYAVGDKLHSIRKVASLYNLSKTTVESAYSQLYAEGYVESRVKSGYYVSELFFDNYKKEQEPTHKSTIKAKTCRYDFFPAQLHKEDFPLKLWKRLYNKVINDEVDFGAYSDGQGELELREQIATYLKDSRGVACDEENIIITHGFIDSMELVAKLAKKRYKHFAQETPGYHIAHKVFGSYGYTIQPIGVDENGLIISQLKSSNAQIVYITPSHQYPTGATMPVSNRLKLISYMQSIGGLIIEDDYDSELAYYNRPIPSLQGLDRGENVVYLGTFAKALSPSIRVGYMVVPSWMMTLYKESYDAHFARVSITTQLTLANFMKEGHWDRHLRRIRILNKKKHQAMKEALETYLKDSYSIVSEGAGLAILIIPTKEDFDWKRCKKLAEENDIGIYLAKERSGGEFEAVRMGFGGFKIEEIEGAVEVFSEVWNQSITT